MAVYKNCPGAKEIKSPYPEEVKCPCGNAVEIWSDEVSATCKRCNRRVTRGLPQTCLDWCSMAKECAGDAKYKKYLQFKTAKKGGKK